VSIVRAVLRFLAPRALLSWPGLIFAIAMVASGFLAGMFGVVVRWAAALLLTWHLVRVAKRAAQVSPTDASRESGER
jgi:membrane protein implicated in regulation of membrane protease activity